jgi:glycolate oxidase FAD binding subunit
MSASPNQKVVSPQSTEQVAEALRYANEQKLAVEIAGAGTKRGWGNPVAAALVLDMKQLSGVREHSWQDLTATVAAGTPWSVMQSALALHGQRVALDPLWPDRATVGGIIATNDSGSLRLRYGSLRDLIIGMTVVLADGTIAKTGGKVVKNVAGYDLHKLMTGALGTLGVIAEVTFRLHPLPKSSATWTITSDDIQAVDRIRHELADSTMSIESLQIRTGDGTFFLDVKFVILPEALEDHARRLHTLASPLAISVGEDDVWHARRSLFDVKKATIKVAISAAQIASLSSDIQSVDGVCVIQQSGIATASLLPDAVQIAALRKRIEGVGGSLTVLDWPAEVVPKPDRWGTLSRALPLMREIKRQFDPNGILNPGRFLGGI